MKKILKDICLWKMLSFDVLYVRVEGKNYVFGKGWYLKFF